MFWDNSKKNIYKKCIKKKKLNAKLERHMA